MVGFQYTVTYRDLPQQLKHCRGIATWYFKVFFQSALQHFTNMKYRLVTLEPFTVVGDPTWNLVPKFNPTIVFQ